MSLLCKAALMAAAPALLLAGSVTPAHAEPAVGERILVAASGDFTAQASWSQSKSWGSTAGTITYTSASGWVKDLAADGYCAQVEIQWYGSNGKSDTDYSGQACPKDDVDNFSKAPGDSTSWTATGYAVYLVKVAT